MRVAVGEALEPHAVEHGADDAGRLLATSALQPERHVGGHGEVREERVVLEDHADTAELGLDETARPHHLEIANRNPPARGTLDAGHQAKQRGLAGARRPEQAQHLPVRDAQRHLIKRLAGTVPNADGLDGQLGT